jgi:hypothetical protein
MQISASATRFGTSISEHRYRTSGVEAKEATVAAPSSRLLKETAMEIAGVYDQFKQQRRVQATVASTY